MCLAGALKPPERDGLLKIEISPISHRRLRAPGSWQEGKQRVSSVTKVSGHVAECSR